jgi:hypothetical protein
LGSALEMIKLYNKNSVIKNGVHPDETVIEEGKKIVLGRFVDIKRPTFMEGLTTVSQLQGTMWPKNVMATKH